ncbi:NnrS family protein [Iodobacter sp.]|uniref:NnrS family protein n=1 Tax=Iodobacter sp. TaxID=1915058 RepID=UPI0025DCEFD6|nr:NnrS family protein [Iodobacter sp.]
MKTFLSAPHRVGFFSGTLLLILSLAWWASEMLLRAKGSTLASSIAPMFLHGYLMLYGFFPLFMLGFIYTAGPKWLNVASPSAPLYVPIILGYALGSALLIAALAWPSLLILGIALHFLSWGAACWVWFSRILASHATDRSHAIAIALAFGLGWLGQGFALFWVAFSSTNSWLSMVEIGLWGFLLPVFLTVSHRMLPFFSANALANYTAWRPRWLLNAMLALAWAHAAFRLAGHNSIGVDVLFAGLLLYTSWRWRLFAALQNRLLAMLHLAFAWAGIAMLLYTVQDAAALAGWAILGFAPLHALTIGFFGTMLLGFATRVSLGHAGLPLLLSRMAWTLYCLLHGVTLARVLADIIGQWQTPLLCAAALGALAAFLLWGSRFMPVYLKPRADGKAG